MEIKSSKQIKTSDNLSYLKERAACSLKPSQCDGFLEDKLNLELKSKILDILYDLMYSGDIKAAVTSVENNKLIDGIEFTKRALLFGIERQAYEMELISRLLSACYEIFNDNEIVDGFQLMLFRLPDVSLDVPHAPSILAKFISRAIYDEIVPPIFIKDAHTDNEKAKECMALVFEKVNSKEGLEHIWGPGDFHSVRDLKIEVDNILEQYLENPDLKGTTESIVNLKVPSFFGEIIKRGIFKSIGKTEQERVNFINLLEHWSKINLINDGYIKRGFSMAQAQLPNIGVPNASNILSTLQNAATEKKLLPSL